MLTVILGGWGSGNWIGFLVPLILLLIVIKTGEWLNKWIRSYVIPKFFKKKKQQQENLDETELSFT